MKLKTSNATICYDKHYKICKYCNEQFELKHEKVDRMINRITCYKDECKDKLREISDSIYEYAKDIQVDPVEPFKEAYEDIANKIEKLADELMNVWENGTYQGKDLDQSK